MNRLQKKLRALWRRRQLDRDLEEEMRFHLEMAAEETGTHDARRRFGSPTAVKETCREMWAFTILEAWWRDVRYGLRMLLKNPGFTAVAVTALALGIGADTAMYTIVTGAFSWNMGLDDPNRIVILTPLDAANAREFASSYPDFRDFRSQLKSLSGLGAYQFDPVNLSDHNALPERYYCVKMSANGFSVVGQKPMLGRDFLPDDERLGAPPVLILGYHVWRDRYNQDPAIIGKTIRIDEIPRVVVGVMPWGRRFPEETDLWTPLVPDAAQEKRDNRSLMLFGRLADGVQLASARAESATVAQRLAGQYPDTNKNLSADIRPIMEITGLYFMRPLFVALFVAVAFVLLIACADVANMLLARGAGRSREISIRFAIGAGRIPIIRQLLLESVVLAIAGGFLGWLVALAGLRLFDSGVSVIPKPVWLHLSLDASALLYLTAISVGTGILFGLFPALRLVKTDINSALKDGSVGVVGSRFGLRLSKLLVASQMALCVVLLAGAGLMIRSVVNLYSTPIGVNTSGVLTMRLNLPEAKYVEPEKQIAFHDALKKRFESLPGVEVASLASNLPLGGWIPFSMQTDGVAIGSAEPPNSGAIITGSDYFRVMQVQPRRGRLFTGADTASSIPVAIVNESFATKFWPGQDPLGKRLRLIEEHSPELWLTVIGTVPDILQNIRQPLERDPLVYLPYAQKPQRQVFLAARTGIPPAKLAQAFRREVQSLDENLPVYDVRDLDNRIAENRLTARLLGAICSIFAGIATVLAAIGLYAVVAHAVKQRSEEIGLRIALGATTSDVARLVFAQGLRPLGPGLLVGLLLALATTRALRVTLVGVSSADPITFLTVVVVLILAAVLGCVVPARRAMQIDPIAALRSS